SLAPMILGGKLPGKVGRCRFFISIKTYDGIKNCAECEALAPFLFGSAVAELFLFRQRLCFSMDEGTELQ
ncbi:MAG: hypothetical protein IKU09_11335, partial [Firmicutes bacterium]|nr:hypothetical protein [Bacillota bacterium]